MFGFLVLLASLLFVAPAQAASTAAPKDLKDLYYGEALYYAYQGEWFDAIAGVDTELMQHYGVNLPKRDTLHYHINQAEFDVGDFELAYRMHQRAGRAIKAVIEGNVEERNVTMPFSAWPGCISRRTSRNMHCMLSNASAVPFPHGSAPTWLFCARISPWPSVAMPRPSSF